MFSQRGYKFLLKDKGRFIHYLILKCSKQYMMDLRILIGLCFFGLIGCGSSPENKRSEEVADSVIAEAAEVETASMLDFPVYDFDAITTLLNKKNDTTYIVNFWATWCKPCVEELPNFEKTFAEQKNNKVELILVSLDMRSMWQKRLVPFVEKNDLKGSVVILDDPKMNEWIPKVDQQWSGGIPATLIYNSSKRSFFEQSMTYEELNLELRKFIN